MKPLDVDVICAGKEGLVFGSSHVKNLSPKYFNVCNVGHLETSWDVNQRRYNFDDLCKEKTEKGIIFLDPSQHWVEYTSGFMEVVSNYKYKVMIVEEPIRNRLTTDYLREQPLKSYNYVMDLLEPDVVGHCCLTECRMSPTKSFYWTCLVDNVVKEEEEEEEGEDIKKLRVISAGKELRFGREWKDIKYLCWESHLPYEMVPHGTYSYADLSKRISQSAFQFQPRCGYHFHPLRSLQSWFVGTIPIIFVENLECEEFIEHQEKLPLRHLENCIILNKETMPESIDACKSGDHVCRMLDNVRKMDLTNYTTEKVCENMYKSILEID